VTKKKLDNNQFIL